MKRRPGLIATAVVLLWFASIGVLTYISAPEAQPRHVVPSSTLAGLPAVGVSGAEVFVTDATASQGLTIDTGSALKLIGPTNFTTGSVRFTGSNGATSQDSANLFWDDTNNRLGIGTATPSAQLHATGNATIDGTLTMGAFTLTGTLSSTKACATGYTRVLPNYCRRNTNDGLVWSDVVACTSRTLSSGAPVPADAKAVHLMVQWEALSNNAIAARANDVTFFSDTGCTIQAGFSRFDLREFATVTAGTIIGAYTDHLIVPTTGTNTVHTTQTNAGGNGNAAILNHNIVGYFD